jgi:hypothetical protein
VEVGLKGVGRALSKAVLGVLAVDELFELGLDVDDLIGWELELDDWDLGCLEVRKEANFVGLLNVSLCIILKSNSVYDPYLEEEQAATLGIRTTSRPSDTVNVVPGVVRRIELDNEVDSRDLFQLV